jgi:hypothetical protein
MQLEMSDWSRRSNRFHVPEDRNGTASQETFVPLASYLFEGAVCANVGRVRRIMPPVAEAPVACARCRIAANRRRCVLLIFLLDR